MKKLVLMILAITVFSVAAVASVSKDSSWDDIYMYGLDVDAPKITMDNYFVNVLDTCIDGDHIRPLNPIVRECAEYSVSDPDEQDDMNCERWEERSLSTPIAYTYELCVDQDADMDTECQEYATYPATHDLEYDIDVYESSNDNDEGRPAFPLFTKNFAIPACSL